MAATLGELASLVEGRVDRRRIGRGPWRGDAAGRRTGRHHVCRRDEKAEKLAATRARAALFPSDFQHDRLTMPAIAGGRCPSRPSLRSCCTFARRRPPADRHQPAGDGQPFGADRRRCRHSSRRHDRRRREIGAGLDHPLRRPRHGRLPTGRKRDDLSQRGAVREHGGRAPIGHPRRRGASARHGFGYRLVDGQHQPSAQLGNVEIGADVEIGACTTIDRGTYGPTDRRRHEDRQPGDDRPQLPHRPAQHALLAGRHRRQHDRPAITSSWPARSASATTCTSATARCWGPWPASPTTCPPAARMLGIPATPEREQKLRLAAIAKLPEMRSKLNQLERSLARAARIGAPSAWTTSQSLWRSSTAA